MHLGRKQREGEGTDEDSEKHVDDFARFCVTFKDKCGAEVERECVGVIDDEEEDSKSPTVPECGLVVDDVRLSDELVVH